MNYMVDIETLATSHDAAILSIGACEFDPYMGKGVSKLFYRNITQLSNKAFGRKTDPETIEWWLQQSPEAQAKLFTEPRVPLIIALADFRDFIGKGKPKLWSNGPTFDEDILRNAFKNCDVEFPVHYSGSRCVRTTNALLKHRGIDKPERSGTHHNALDDAIFQAECVILAFQH